MKVVIRNPVFVSNYTGKRVPVWDTIKRRSYINSVFTYVDEGNIQEILNRSADVYASYGAIMAHKVRLSHFEEIEHELTEDDLLMFYVHFSRVSTEPIEGYLGTFALTDNMPEKDRIILYYNYLSKETLIESYGLADVSKMIDCYRASWGERRAHWLTEDMARSHLSYYEFVHCGQSPPYTVYDYEIFPAKIKRARVRGDKHYVYTLFDPITKNVLYVGYTEYPEQRKHSHTHNQRNIYLIDWMEKTGRTPKMNIIYKSNSYRDALDYETEAIIEYGKYYELANIAKNPYR